MKKPIYKKWWFWVIIVVIVIGIGESALQGDDPADDSQDNAAIQNEESSDENSENNQEKAKESIEKSNKYSAWGAVDYYCRNTKEWSITEFSLQKVEIKDNQYYVYVDRDMVDGSIGTFLYILEPVNTNDDGRVEQFHLVEDVGYLVE